ncbi:MAG: HAD family hydrolase [Chloroflexota bacterium]|nr:HAD family hydrolase [Chloroflexota bacterium]
MPSQLKAILFDFDDTLIDWSGVALGWRELEAKRLSRVLSFVNARTEHNLTDLDSLVDTYTERTRDAWAAASANLRAPIMPDILLSTLTDMGVPEAASCLDEVLSAYDWSAVPGTVVYPDVPPALELLRSNGIRAGIVTNASLPMWMRDNELREHGLIDYFSDCRLSAADVGYLKPHSRIFRRALEEMGASAEETVFVGDNPVADVAGAQAVGMLAVRRLNPGASDNGHLAKPHEIVTSLAELPSLLDNWYPDWRQNGK